MKKLSLKSLNFGANNLLGRQALKMVFGGYGSCGVRVDYADGYSYWACGSSQTQALSVMGHYNNLGGLGSAYIGTICCNSGCSGYC